MSDDALVKRRWLAIVATRLAGSAGAVFGVILLARATTIGPKLLGVAIIVSALAMMAIVPRSLAARWRTPPET